MSEDDLTIIKSVRFSKKMARQIRELVSFKIVYGEVDGPRPTESDIIRTAVDYYYNNMRPDLNELNRLRDQIK